VIQAAPGTTDVIFIPSEHDPRLVDSAGKQRQRLGQLISQQRTFLVLERYPELRAVPNCNWQQLSVRSAFSVLYGESSRHFARLQLAALAGIVATAGVTAAYAIEMDFAVRSVLDLLQQEFGISSPQAITVDVWEAWGRNTSLMRTLPLLLRKYAAAVNHHLADYRERLSQADLTRVAHLLLPPMPKQFRFRFVPEAEQRAVAQRKRKAKTDVISECATAILALMLARYPSTDRFIRWYRRQIERIDAGELSTPARLIFEDEQLDLPRQPGPDAVSVDQLRWQTTPVRLELTIWRPYEFSQQRRAERLQHATPGSTERKRALRARYKWNRRAKAGIFADPRAYFVEVHPTEAMPWFVGSVIDWFAQPGQARRANGIASNGRLGLGHAGVGSPDEWLAKYLAHAVASADRQQDRYASKTGVCFEPESMYRGVLFGTAIVTLMLTADARIHEILQISADRFVRPVRVYVVKGPDGTPKREPTTSKIITDVIVEQRLLPKGRQA